MKKYILCLLVACGLVACGGGGSDSPATTPVTTPVTKTCANGATDPNCVDAPAKLVTSVPVPPFTTGSEHLKAFNYFNNIRASMGLGLLAYNTELENSAINHAKYMDAHAVSGFGEDANLSGFTGADVISRAIYAGYRSLNNGGKDIFVGGGLATANTESGAIQALMNTIYHRSSLIGQGYTDVGSAWYCATTVPAVSGCLNILVGGKTGAEQRNSFDFMSVYPIDGAKNVDLTAMNETVNPFPVDYPNGLIRGKVGYPVSFAIEESQRIVINSFTLTEQGKSTPLDAYLMTKATDPNNYIRQNEAYLTSKTILNPSIVYVAVVDATGITKAGTEHRYKKTWTFTTADRILPSF